MYAIIIILLILIIFILLYWNSKNETFEQPRIYSNNFVYEDELPINQIDSTTQRKIDIQNNGNEIIDNQDIIEQVIRGVPPDFQPDHELGISATRGTISNHEYNPYMSDIMYSVPLNEDAYDADEAMARAQQYRSALNKMAIDGRVRTTKNTYKRLFQQELCDNENKRWWSAESSMFNAPIQQDF